MDSLALTPASNSDFSNTAGGNGSKADLSITQQLNQIDMRAGASMGMGGADGGSGCLLGDSVSSTSHVFTTEDGSTLCVCHNRCLEFIELPKRYVTPLAEDTVLAATGLQHVRVQDPGVKRNMRLGFNRSVNKELEAFHKLVLLAA